MKELSLKEIQNISFDILVNIADFCERNNISYFLACGTLLGAAKYKGFIPWDDDIDIMMPRPDYNRFIKEYIDDRYIVNSPHTGYNYYAKVYDSKTIKIENGTDYKKYKPLGIDIDVFPLDGMINDAKTAERICKISKFLELLLRLSNQPIFYRKNPLKCINRIIPRIIGSKNIVLLIEKNAQRYKYENSDYVIRVRYSPNGHTGILPKKIYEKEKLYFENREFVVPSGYDVWLRNFYGNNYLKEEPPKEKQVSHHKNKCYLKEEIN